MTTPWWLLGGGYRGFSMQLSVSSAASDPRDAQRPVLRRTAPSRPRRSPRAATASHHASAVSSAITSMARTLRTAIATSREDAGWIGSTGPWATSAARPQRICCRDAAGLQPGKPRVHVIGTRQPDPQRQKGAETSTMDTNDTTMSTGPVREARSGCLVEGCPCRDARIVSHRRARFFAHLAEVNGETAQRVIRPEPGWELPRTA